MRFLPLTLAVLLLAPSAPAQKSDHPHHRRADSVISRADSVDAPTGLSADEVVGLREGLGMGLARSAELHSYPGPLHVLELADALDLTAEQRATAERLRAEMLAEARPLGAQIIERERRLDNLFATGAATPEMVDRITAHIAEAQGQLRAAHLRAHVAMRDVLTPQQVAEYDRLRGYTDGPTD
jgi:Spy/CpxP family protein refolding chaperone